MVAYGPIEVGNRGLLVERHLIHARQMMCQPGHRWPSREAYRRSCALGQVEGLELVHDGRAVVVADGNTLVTRVPGTGEEELVDGALVRVHRELAARYAAGCERSCLDIPLSRTHSTSFIR